MSINIFFILLLGLLLGMYNYFTPNYILSKDVGEVPKIELFSFTLYEISHKGIDHILEGKEGKKFDDRYAVTSAKFSDNTKTLFQTIESENVDYQSDIIKLKGNVHYAREDGLEFRSNEGKYNTDTAMIQTQGAFVITQKSNRIDGSTLLYDNKNNMVFADHVRVSYQLK